MDGLEREAWRQMVARANELAAGLARRLAVVTAELEAERRGVNTHAYPRIADMPNGYVEPGETELAARVAQGGALAYSEDVGDECDCGFCVPGEPREETIARARARWAA